jgi:ribosomal protein L37E
MAKKGTKAPSRPCEKCGKAYHPRKAECPWCGTANPTARKKGGAVRSVSANPRLPGRPRKGQGQAAPVNGNALKAAILFVQDAGGFDAAKAALNEIETIRNL